MPSWRRRWFRASPPSRLSIGQALAYVVTASVGFTVLRRQHGPLGLRGTAGMYVKLAVPAVLTALALSWAIRTLLPDLGEVRGVRGLLEGGTVLAVAGLIAAQRDLGGGAPPRRARDRRRPRADHPQAPAPLSSSAYYGRTPAGRG